MLRDLRKHEARAVRLQNIPTMAPFVKQVFDRQADA
jgi:hypothetical protein